MGSPMFRARIAAAATAPTMLETTRFMALSPPGEWLLDADLAAHRPVPLAEVRVDTGLREIDGGGGALALEAMAELAVGALGSARGDGMGDVVLVREAYQRSRRHLDGRGLELKRLDGHALRRARGRAERYEQAERHGRTGRRACRCRLPTPLRVHHRLLGGALATHGGLRRWCVDGLGRGPGVSRRGRRGNCYLRTGNPARIAPDVISRSGRD